MSKRDFACGFAAGAIAALGSAYCLGAYLIELDRHRDHALENRKRELQEIMDGVEQSVDPTTETNWHKALRKESSKIQPPHG
jgi:uncharacterized membrane protein YgaE (UPF0421/DUF939 family)